MTVNNFAAFYARYVEFCAGAGVEPVAPDRAAAILAELGPLAPIPITVLPADRLEGGTVTNRGYKRGYKWHTPRATPVFLIPTAGTTPRARRLSAARNPSANYNGTQPMMP
jgi:hypothetical protein